VISTEVASVLWLTFLGSVADAHPPTWVDVVGAVGRFFDINRRLKSPPGVNLNIKLQTTTHVITSNACCANFNVNMSAPCAIRSDLPTLLRLISKVGVA
jgi:hypothetical protein